MVEKFRDFFGLLSFEQGQVCGEDPKPTGALAPQDAHLMSKGNELKFKVGAATNTEREQGNEGGKTRDHAHNGTDMARKSLGSLGLSEF